MLCELRSMGCVLSCGYECMHRKGGPGRVYKAGSAGRHGVMEGGCRPCGNRDLGDLGGKEAGGGVGCLSFP